MSTRARTRGPRRGFAVKHRFKEGIGATSKYYEVEWEFTQADVAIGDSHVIRPLFDKRHDYQEESTSTSDRITTDFTPSLHPSSLALEKRLQTDPAVATSENGSGVATSRTPYWRTDGTRSFTEARDGVITYSEYTDGLLSTRIEDADTSETSDFDITVPAGLSSDSEALHVSTTYAYDAQGRIEETTAPDGQITKIYYSKLADGRLVTLRYPDYDASPAKFYGPVRYTVLNHSGEKEVRGVIGLTGNETTLALTSHIDETEADPLLALDVGSVEQMSVRLLGDTGHSLEEVRSYHSVPTSGAGTDGTHYDPIIYGYDDMGRVWRVKQPHGTITRTVYDALGRQTQTWTGTNDSSFAGGDPGTDNMVKVEELEYDSDNDGGNSTLSKVTAFVEDGTTGKRETTYKSDLRGRVVLETLPEAPHFFHALDNRGRRTATGTFSSTANINTGTDNPTTETSNRVGLTRAYYDDMGRLWKTTQHKVDVADGSDDDNLESLFWRDARGRVIKQDGRDLAKTAYGRLGRVSHRFTLADDDDTSYGDADDVVGDHVVVEQQEVLDEHSLRVLLRARIERHHDDWGAGSTTGALNTNADADDLLVTTSNLKGRPQITCYWYDHLGRVVDEVRYGNNGGSNLDRDGLAVPVRSDTALRTTYTYNTSGLREDVTNEIGVVTRREFDGTGRTTKIIRNYDGAVNGGAPSGTDDNVTTKYEFTDGLLTKMTVDMPTGVTDQTTTYRYGTTKGAGAGDSKIAAGNLMLDVEYPASAGDKVSFAYNAQRERIWHEDQCGNVVQIDRDGWGREEHSRVTTLASGFDGAVRRISRTYDDLGRVSTVTQYDNAAVGSGSATDEVRYRYDGWGNVTTFEQDPDGTLGGTGSEYEISYTYVKASGGRNTTRRSSITLPSGNDITIEYLFDKNDELSRVSRLKDGSTVLVRYQYLGAANLVGTTYLEPAVSREAFGATSGSYPSLDNFNRTVTYGWSTGGASPVAFHDVDVGYDRNSDPILVEDNIHLGFDVDYTLDDLGRMTMAEEGTWSGSSITSRSRQQDWTLGHTGNWDRVRLDLNGDNDFTDSDTSDPLDYDEFDDDRTHNEVNELTAQDTDDDGTDDYTLTFDDAGHLTDDEQAYQYEYDAYGRLRKVRNQDTPTPQLVAEYRYNGLGFMIAVHEDNDAPLGTLDADDEWFYRVHDESWRLVANFREDDVDPKEEFVPQLAGRDGRGRASYVNDVVCRNKDADTSWNEESDGTLEERYYICHGQKGVAVLVESGRYMGEWKRYLSYGTPIGLPGGDADSDGKVDATDASQVQSWIDASAYDVRGDVDLDGDVDSTDKYLIEEVLDGLELGYGSLSWLGDRRGFGGYERMSTEHYLSRRRILDPRLGRWLKRDGMEYVDGPNLYEYVSSRSVRLVDPSGLMGVEVAPGGGDGGDGDEEEGPSVDPESSEECKQQKKDCEQCLFVMSLTDTNCKKAWDKWKSVPSSWKVVFKRTLLPNEKYYEVGYTMPNPNPQGTIWYPDPSYPMWVQGELKKPIEPGGEIWLDAEEIAAAGKDVRTVLGHELAHAADFAPTMGMVKEAAMLHVINRGHREAQGCARNFKMCDCSDCNLDACAPQPNPPPDDGDD